MATGKLLQMGDMVDLWLPVLCRDACSNLAKDCLEIPSIKLWHLQIPKGNDLSEEKRSVYGYAIETLARLAQTKAGEVGNRRFPELGSRWMIVILTI